MEEGVRTCNRSVLLLECCPLRKGFGVVFLGFIFFIYMFCMLFFTHCSAQECQDFRWQWPLTEDLTCAVCIRLHSCEESAVMVYLGPWEIASERADDRRFWGVALTGNAVGKEDNWLCELVEQRNTCYCVVCHGFISLIQGFSFNEYKILY